MLKEVVQFSSSSSAILVTSQIGNDSNLKNQSIDFGAQQYLVGK